MTLSLHEQRILTEIDRELSRDTELRTLAAYLSSSPASQTWTRQSEPDSQAVRGYLVTEDSGGSHSPRKRRLLTVLATIVFLIGPLMLIPALLTGVSAFAAPVLAAPLLGLAMLAVARRKDAGQ